MPHLPVLRVVPLRSIRRHEEIDPLRVSRLEQRIAAEGIQVNPMVCVEAPGHELVLLDGATRTEALKSIGLEHAVVQVVDPGTVELDTWHHVIRGCRPEDVLAAIGESPGLTLTDQKGAPRVRVSEGPTKRVTGVDLRPNATLSALVAGYVGKWTITRTTDPRRKQVTRSFPDWAAIVEFPTLTISDVMGAAVGEDLVPAGITRFLVPERALRLNAPLSLLASDQTEAEKQSALDELLEQRARDGRVRRYDEPVFILDD